MDAYIHEPPASVFPLKRKPECGGFFAGYAG
jgi:hypothetical protein